MNNSPERPSLPALFDLSGRVAIVTGGAGLLGSEFCKTLLEAGARVIVADLDVLAAQRLAANLRPEGAPGDRILAVETDVTDPTSVQALVVKALQAFGRLDILVNSAALDPKFDPQHSEGPQSSAFEEYPLPAIYQRTGRPPQSKPVYYSVTKAGILGLTQYLAAYYAGRNIRVNALSPGGVFNGHDAEFVQAYSARAVMGRMANKDEMNGALLYLVSDASAYMTGANLVVDGGWTAW